MPVPLLQFQAYNPMDTLIKTAMGTYSGLGEAKGRQIQNQISQSQLPYAQENARNEALLKSIQTQYAPQKAAMDYQKAIIDLQQADQELQMYGENQSSLNNYRDALSAVNWFKLNNPALMGSGAAKDIATWGLTDEGQIGGGMPNRHGIPAGPSSFSGMEKPQAQSSLQPQPVPSQVNAAISANPNIANNPNYVPVQGMHGNAPMGSPYQQAKNIALAEAGKTSAEKATESERAVQNVKAYEKKMEELGTTAALAGEENQVVDSILSVYKDIPEGQKGAFLGELKAIHPDAKIFEALEKGLVLEELRKSTGTQSDQDMRGIESQFGGKTLNDSSKEKLLTIYKIQNNREIERQKFYADREGTPVRQIDAEWNKQLQNRSIFKEPEYQLVEFNQKIRNMTPEQRKRAIEDQAIKVQMMQEGVR